MDKKNYLIVKELKNRLSSFLNIIDLRIFGSRARGDHEQLSDMDLFIEVKSLTKEQKERIYDIIWEIGFENLIVISTIICTQEEVEQSPLRSSPILKNIFEEGIQV